MQSESITRNLFKHYGQKKVKSLTSNNDIKIDYCMRRKPENVIIIIIIIHFALEPLLDNPIKFSQKQL